jgi:5-formaminoimidazole-4-carboxamide-1-(beta)-D-ribofuranosyl 5'-monophosphate synthetase
VLGSHSALEVAFGAKKHGFATVVVCERGRERTYAERYLTRPATDGPGSDVHGARASRGCVDYVLLVDRFADILATDVQSELNERRSVWVPHRSFEVYLGSDYDAIESGFRVPMFGNRYLLRIEERSLHPNQYDLLLDAGIPHPQLFSHPVEIDRPVMVKVPEAARGFERAFFIARDRDEFERIASARVESGVSTAEALAGATIEEFVLGAQVNLNFFWSPLNGTLELLGTDTRRQTNVSGLASLPATLHQSVLDVVRLSYEEAGHVAATVLESMLERAFELGERFVAAAARTHPPGVIGPFALQCIVVPGPPKKDFVVVDVSPRMPGSPGIAATPYSAYLHGRPVSAGERVAMELRQALDERRMNEVLT